VTGQDGWPPFRRAVVTGGAGFLGAWVSRRLLAQGTAVVCVDSFLTSDPDAVRDLNRDPGFELRRADVSQGLAVDGDLDLVLHLASPASPADSGRHRVATLDAGSAGTRHALELACAHQARFVLASTSEVYGDPLVSPQPEGYWGNVNPVGPRSCYDEAKRFAEALTMAYREEQGADTGIARIFNTYGPGMRPGDGRMIPAFVTQALRGEPVTVTGDGLQTRSLCYAGDLANGLLLLAASGEAGPVNLGNPDEATVLDIARRVIALTGSDSQVEFVPRPTDDPMVRCPDISRARRLLGFEPEVGWEDGLRQTIGWFAGQLSRAGAARP
jgi:dTDP-glucose 4,6-dehydratase